MSALEPSVLFTNLMFREAKLTLLAVYVFLATVKPHGAKFKELIIDSFRLQSLSRSNQL